MTLAYRLIPTIDSSRCSGCGRCVSACPPRLFSLKAEGWHKVSVLRDDHECTGCVRCAVECPVHAITMRKRPAQPALRAGAGRGGHHPIIRIIESRHAEHNASPE